ncbi:MAG: PASTA domain-containing protein [Crocinitomicaceae bacterium]|nr:PASTA domain-containing protein [Crocinitomicaceae bacterium]
MNNEKDIANKAYMVFAGIIVISMAIIVRVFLLQAIPSQKANELAQNFTYKINDIYPTRGQIISSDGSLLATSVPEYEIRWDSQAAFNKALFNSKVDSLSLCFSRLTGDRTATEYKALIRGAIKEKDRYKKIIDHIDYNQLQQIKSFPFVRLGKSKSGFIFIEKNRRTKPFGSLAARTVGLEREENKVGLELAYNDLLSGKKGEQLQKKIAGGIWAPMSDEFIVEPEAGCDIVATIDVHLQDVAHAALERQLIQHNAAWGCAILMEVETGYVRAIANLGQNPETGGYEERLNYAISQSVEPGSTMKLASLMACLDEGMISLEDTVNTGNGIVYFYGKPMKDSNWDKGGHGILTAEQVFEVSSNIGTAKFVKKCFEKKPQQFLDKLHSFGIGDRLQINLAGEPNPLLYSKTTDKGWSGLSLTQLAIGYETQYTPLQTLCLYNAIANDGKYVQPQFVQEIKKNGKVIEKTDPVILHKNICKKETISQCKKMMEGVMEKGGTADYVFKSSPYKVAGKTGTAWINESGSYQLNRYRASFVGYFPAENPRYSCIVVVHDPRSGVYYGSTVAAPVFKELADKIYSTQIEFHAPEPNVDSVAIAQKKILVSKSGSSKDLLTVFRGLNIPVEEENKSEWINTASNIGSVKTTPRTISKNLVPNVIGMGLQDAIYLLENQGMNVHATGVGTVKRQSVQPGTQVKSNPNILIELS